MFVFKNWFYCYIKFLLIIVAFCLSLVAEAAITVSSNKMTLFTISRGEECCITEHIDLGGETLVIPEDCCLVFKNGSICNGSVIFQNTKLKGRIALYNISCSGSIRNKILRISWFQGSMLSLKNIDLSGHVLALDKDIVLDSPLILNHVNGFKLDGKGNRVETGNVDSFVHYVSSCSNIEVCNVNYYGTIYSNFFSGYVEKGSGTMSKVSVHDNYVETCRLGISFNADESSSFSNSDCYNNTVIMNNPSDKVGCYGIHLANIHHCRIYNNYVTGANRHAIYHAYGSYNEISRNILENNKPNSSDDNSVVHIIRKSQHVKFFKNIFRNNGGAALVCCSHAMESGAENGDCDDIEITDNTFYDDGTNNQFRRFIIIGTNSADGYFTKNIVIKNNKFTRKDSNKGSFINIFNVVGLDIIDNDFIDISENNPTNGYTDVIAFNKVKDCTITKNIVISDNTFSMNHINPSLYFLSFDVGYHSYRNETIRCSDNNFKRYREGNYRLTTIDCSINAEFLPNVKF